MPNRVIKDSIWHSPSLAKLSIQAQLHWPRWLLMADDWGCFNADTDVIKGLIYPKMERFTKKNIENLKIEYFENGKLFLWQDEAERYWGFFISWNNHQYCNATHLNEDGKQARHKRKTPEPQITELNEYLQLHKKKLERVRAVKDKYRNPIPIPIPSPNYYGHFSNVLLSEDEMQKLREKLNSKADDFIERLSEYIESKGIKYKSHYATILSWHRRESPTGKTRHEEMMEEFKDGE